MLTAMRAKTGTVFDSVPGEQRVGNTPDDRLPFALRLVRLHTRILHSLQLASSCRGFRPSPSAGFERDSRCSLRFEDLCHLLESLGVEKRVKGSHHLFRKSGVAAKINLQRAGTQAKPYQVKQVRAVILEAKLGGE